MIVKAVKKSFQKDAILSIIETSEPSRGVVFEELWESLKVVKLWDLLQDLITLLDRICHAVWSANTSCIYVVFYAEQPLNSGLSSGFFLLWRK